MPEVRHDEDELNNFGESVPGLEDLYRRHEPPSKGSESTLRPPPSALRHLPSASALHLSHLPTDHRRSLAAHNAGTVPRALLPSPTSIPQRRGAMGGTRQTTCCSERRSKWCGRAASAIATSPRRAEAIARQVSRARGRCHPQLRHRGLPPPPTASVSATRARAAATSPSHRRLGIAAGSPNATLQHSKRGPTASAPPPRWFDS